MVYPAIVCAAFSAEVGLKTILKIEQGDSHGHDLLTLFKRLSDGSKLAVMDATGLSVDEFAAQLKHSKKAFTEWRYIYEVAGERMISVAFITKFAEAVEHRLSELRNAA